MSKTILFNVNWKETNPSSMQLDKLLHNFKHDGVWIENFEGYGSTWTYSYDPTITNLEQALVTFNKVLAHVNNVISEAEIEILLNAKNLEDIARNLYKVNISKVSFEYHWFKYPKDENYVNTAVQFLKSLSTTAANKITELDISDFTYIAVTDIKTILSNLPETITSFALPSLFVGDQGVIPYTNDEIIEICKSIPPHIKKIDTGSEYANDIDVEEVLLKKALIHLPFSVKEVVIPKAYPFMSGAFWDVKKTIDMVTFRKDNFFPASYEHLTHEGDLFEKAKALLKDYTKNNNGVVLFFTAHWNRHYTDKVNEALELSNNFDELYNNIKAIKIDNPIGSLARRIRYIEMLLEQERAPTLETDSNLLQSKTI